MLKTYQFKTHCKGDSHSSKTANIILPGLMIKQRWTSLRLQANYSRLFNLGEMSCFNQHHAVQWIWIPFRLQSYNEGPVYYYYQVPRFTNYKNIEGPTILTRNSAITENRHNTFVQMQWRGWPKNAPPHMLPCQIWSFYVKGCRYRYRRTPKTGECWNAALLGWEA